MRRRWQAWRSGCNGWAAPEAPPSCTPASDMLRFPTHTGLTIVTVGLLLGAARIMTTPPRPTPPITVAPAEPVLHAVLPKHRLLTDDGVLDGFYQALDAGRVVRVTHYGDSPTTADLITGDVRSLLQNLHGDAGHGFVLIAKPWAWYGHTGVTVDGKGWQMAPASRFESRDGLFGLGGVSFVGDARAHSKITFDRAQ